MLNTIGPIIFILLFWTAIGTLVWLILTAPRSWFERTISHLTTWRHIPKDPVRLVGYAVLALSSLIAVLGYYNIIPTPQRVIDDFYANVAVELASIAVTVLVIDRIVEWRNDKREKDRIIRQMASHSNDFALDAVRMVAEHRWLYDGSLQGADLSGANLASANLQDANLEGANLWGTNFRRAYLNDANLRMATLESAVLHGAYLSRAKLQGANLSFAILEGSSSWQANFQNANLTGANLHADLSRSDLQNSTLSNANLRGADLSRANFNGASLRGADLRDVILKDTSFNAVEYDEYTKWPKDFDPVAAGAIKVVEKESDEDNGDDMMTA